MYPLPKRGRRLATSYSHRFGVVQQKKSGLRVIVFAMIMVTAGMSLAILQFGQQLEARLNPKPAQAALAEAPTKIEPVKPLAAPANSAEAAYFDPNLQELLQRWADAQTGHDWSVVIKGLEGDKRYASVRGESWYVPASIYKLMLTYSLFKHYSIAEMEKTKITVSGQSRSLKSCVDAMLGRSDNPCGDAVGKMLGWSRIDADLHAAGFNNTFFNRKDAIFTSAEDAANFMQSMYEDKLFGSKEAKNYVMATLQKQIYRAGVPAGCDEGCVVADKTGDLSNVRHDVAIVKSGGKAYVLSVFTSGASFNKIAELTKLVNEYMTATSKQ